MDDKERERERIWYYLAFFVICIPATYAQMVLMVFSVMLTDAGIPELALKNNLTGLFVGLIITAPYVFLLLVGLFLTKIKKVSKVLPIIIFMFIVIMMDLIMPLVGGYSVNGMISDIMYQEKIKVFAENHPEKDENNILISSNSGDLYYNPITKEILRVYGIEITELDKYLDTEDLPTIYRVKVNGEIDVDIVQLTNLRKYQTQTSDSKDEYLKFKVSGSDYIYLIENKRTFQGLDEDVNLSIPHLVIVSKEGSNVMIDKLTEPDQGLEIDMERLTWVFEKDGEVVLSRFMRENPLNINEVDMLKEEGSWKLYIETYSSLFEKYIKISNEISWEQ